MQAVGSVGGDAESATAAATQATGNAQTVAAAAEELSSSIIEIARQVSHSTELAGKAVGLADETQSLARIVRTATADSDRRAHERQPCTIAAIVQASGGGSFETQIADVSRGGLRLADSNTLAAGDRATATIPAFNWSRTAEVPAVSLKGAHLALCDGEIPEAELAQLLAAPAARAA